MYKVKALINYEFLNLRRSKMFYLLILIYLFGLYQQFNSMLSNGYGSITVISYIKNTWIPLNLIIIPLLIIGQNISRKSNEIFETLNIHKRDVTISKIGVLSVVTGVILINTIIILLIIAIKCNVSFTYIMYLARGFIVSLLVYILSIMTIGLFIGKVIVRGKYDFIGYSLILVIFLLVSSYGKSNPSLMAILNMDTFGSTLRFFDYDKLFYLKWLFWITICLILISIMYINESMSLQLRFNMFRKAMLGIGAILTVICIFFTINIGKTYFKEEPELYEILERKDVDAIKQYDGTEYEKSRNTYTYYCDENVGYYVDEYTMNIELGEDIKNQCTMDFIVKADSINNLEFSLYKTLKIEKVILDGKLIDYNRTGNIINIALPKVYSNGDKLKLQVVYNGDVNTIWYQNRKQFYVDINNVFLASRFEWYPKLNDGLNKKYDIEIKNKGINKIYSNLNEIQQGKYSGEDKEIFLLSGELTEKEYKGYRLIGNEELIKTDKQCDELIHTLSKIKEFVEVSEQVDLSYYNPKTIMFGIASIQGNMFSLHNNVYLDTTQDINQFISNGKSGMMMD